jgi:hypothetical protein
MVVRVDVVLNGSCLDMGAHLRLLATVLDWQRREQGHVHTTSSGMVPAVLLICATKLHWSTTHLDSVLARYSVRNARSPTLLEEVLPTNAHQLVDGLLHIYYYAVPWFTPHCVSAFPTRQSLLDAMIFSCAIPLCTLSRYVDGCMVPIFPVRPGTILLVSGAERLRHVVLPTPPAEKLDLPAPGTRFALHRFTLRGCGWLWRLRWWVVLILAQLSDSDYLTFVVLFRTILRYPYQAMSLVLVMSLYFPVVRWVYIVTAAMTQRAI